MSPEEKAASAKRAREARGKKRRRKRKNFKPGDPLPRVRRTRGLVGVRKMIVKALQQQVEAMRDRFLGPVDREFLLEAVKVLVTGEKVAKLPTKPTAPLDSLGEPPKTPLPALDARPTAATVDKPADSG